MLGSQMIDPARGPVARCTAAEGGVQAFQVVMMTAEGLAAPADGSNETHAGRVIGMARSAASEGIPCPVQSGGKIQNPAWDLTPGSSYFLTSGGEISTTPPASGFVQRIGVAKSATELLINMGEPIKR